MGLLPELLQFYDRVRLVQVGRVVGLIFVLVFLAGCSSAGGGAPVYDRTRPEPGKLPAQHVVQKGDTLYSIAWRYGLDYKALSRRNGVDSKFTIYPGQIIYLDLNRKTVTAKSTSVSKTNSTKSRTQVAKTPPKSSAKVAGSTASFTNFAWQWPVKGRIIRNFSPKSDLNKGIDIAGRLGEPVLSAAPGTVVYAGDGLRGYGQLLIIKHNEKFLSAYAHNSKLLVKEGEVVKGSQKIAEIGSSGTDTTKLHFEIRRDGQPVDPLQYLPKK